MRQALCCLLPYRQSGRPVGGCARPGFIPRHGQSEQSAQALGFAPGQLLLGNRLTSTPTALAKRGAGPLSGGQRRRLDIAMGLVHAPPLLILDGPSTGLDPQSRANLWEHVPGIRRRFGTTLFLTTHYLDEADTMAERVMTIGHSTSAGRVAAVLLPRG